MDKLKGKIALITGAGSGIGRAAANLFASEGAKVCVADYVNRSTQEVVAGLTAAGKEAIAIQADVSKPEDVARMIRTVVDAYGRIDVLFNNAGINFNAETCALTADMTLEDWDITLNTNLRSVFLGCKHVIPIMVSHGGGTIVNTASVNGFFAATTTGPYCASKAGVVMLTKVVAAEYGNQGIRANCICPGVTETPMSAPFLSYLDMNHIAQGRPGQPEEQARVALFLASDDSSYVNGAALMVDGGWSAELKIPMKEIAPL